MCKVVKGCGVPGGEKPGLQLGQDWGGGVLLCAPTPPSGKGDACICVMSQGSALDFVGGKGLVAYEIKLKKTTGWLEEPELHSHVQHSRPGGRPRVGDRPSGGRDRAGCAHEHSQTLL